MQNTIITHFPSRNLTAVLIMCLLLSITACATYPTQELSDARQAVRAAEAINADKHLPEAYNKAALLLSKAEEKLNDSPPLYSEAKDNALAAKEAAINARLLTIALLEAQKTIHKMESDDNKLPEARQALEKASSAISQNNFKEAIKYAELAKNLALQGR